MNRDREELRQMMSRLPGILREAGVKLTQQRLEIYREVARSGDHPDIETVYKNLRKRMPSLSLDTVYRTMGLFVELGLVTTIRPLNARVRFDANTGVHHHFVCTRCGLARDFEDRAFDNLPVPAAARSIGIVSSRHVELRGLCPACAARRRNGDDKTTNGNPPIS
jgi:Fur family peroxide stress response transcriptional regulator